MAQTVRDFDFFFTLYISRDLDNKLHFEVCNAYSIIMNCWHGECEIRHEDFTIVNANKFEDLLKKLVWYKRVFDNSDDYFSMYLIDGNMHNPIRYQIDAACVKIYFDELAYI